MATMNDSVNGIVPATADLRKASIDQHRAKNRKVRYKHVNMGLIGTPINPILDGSHPRVEKWNDRNKFKMSDPNCGCNSCRHARYEPKTRSKAKPQGVWDRECDDGSDDACERDNVYRDGVDGVLYSYDRVAGPSHGSQVLTQALDLAIVRMEKKQLDTLIKNEYDIINSEESGSSEDEEYEFIYV